MPLQPACSDDMWEQKHVCLRWRGAAFGGFKYDGTLCERNQVSSIRELLQRGGFQRFGENRTNRDLWSSKVMLDYLWVLTRCGFIVLCRLRTTGQKCGRVLWGWVRTKSTKNWWKQTSQHSWHLSGLQGTLRWVFSHSRIFNVNLLMVPKFHMQFTL